MLAMLLKYYRDKKIVVNWTDDIDYSQVQKFTTENALDDKLVEQFKNATIQTLKVKDIIKTLSKISQMEGEYVNILMPATHATNLIPVKYQITDSKIEEYKDKIKIGEKIPPILLISTDVLTIVDGYYRLYAIYSLNRQAYVNCKIVNL